MLEAVVGVALRAILASVLLGGVLAALVLVATRTLSLTAATRHALWTTALVATALMPLAGVGMSLARATAAATSAPAPVHAVQTVSEAGSSPAAEEFSFTTFAVIDNTAATTTKAAPPAPSFADRLRIADRLAFAAGTPRVSRALASGVAGVWALGALVGLIGLAASVVRVRGLKRRSSPLDGTLADELPWLTEVGPGREIYLRLSYETETPVAIGFRRPVILIPTELATADGLVAIESLILHEHAHLRRYDDWTNLLQRAIERVFWFNPIVWLVGRRIALEREIASDDAVVEKTGEAHAYATSLWKLVREMRMPEHTVVAPGALLTRKQITVRIEQLLDKKRARLHRSPTAAVGVALAGVLSVAFVATSAPAVELPAAPAPVTAAAPASHAAHRSHARYTAAHGTLAAKRLAGVAGTASAAHDSWKTVSPKNPVAKNHAAPDAPTKAMQAQLELLRAQLAAAKTQAAVKHETSIRIADRTHEALPAPPSAIWREVPPAPPAPGGLAPLAPMPVIVPTAPAMPAHSIAKIQALTAAAGAAAARVRETARLRYDADIERTIKAAMASIPHEIALEMRAGSTRHSRFDGMKLTREMVASCVACSFRNADARGLDLHDLKINADNFSGADMRGVNLSGAKLAGVSLAGTNLSNADLRGAMLTGVEFRGAVFDGAQLEGVRLAGVSVRRLNLRGAALRSVLANCVGCDFGGLDLHGQDLHGLTLTGGDFNHADLHDANLSGVHFFSVDLSHANLSGADLTNARFETCDLDSADMRGARTSGMTTHTSGSDG
jgi:uncharacterized protein YjbI with pentapeptide repeats/beta-lactamase regulating signal transducer with metallopeptidase domain